MKYAHLDIMLSELLCKRFSTSRERIDCIIDGNLTVLMVEKVIYILPTFS